MIAKEIPVEMVYQDDQVIVISDIAPKAPEHKLIIPKKHIATVNEINEEDNFLIGYLFQIAKKVAHHLKLSKQGYRLVMNCNEGAGQSVFHIHLHLLGGRLFTWPPG